MDRFPLHLGAVGSADLRTAIVDDICTTRRLVAQDLACRGTDIDALDVANLKSAQLSADGVAAQQVTVANELCLGTLKATDAEVENVTVETLTVTGSADLPGGGGGGGGEADTIKTDCLEPRDGAYAVQLGNTLLHPDQIEIVDVEVKIEDGWNDGSQPWAVGPYTVPALRVGHVIKGSVNALQADATNEPYPDRVPPFNTTPKNQGLKFTFTLTTGAIRGARVGVLPVHNPKTGGYRRPPIGLSLLTVIPAPSNSVTIGTGDAAITITPPDFYSFPLPNEGPTGMIAAISPHMCHVGADFELYLA